MIPESIHRLFYSANRLGSGEGIVFIRYADCPLNTDTIIITAYDDFLIPQVLRLLLGEFIVPV